MYPSPATTSTTWIQCLRDLIHRPAWSIYVIPTTQPARSLRERTSRVLLAGSRQQRWCLSTRLTTSSLADLPPVLPFWTTLLVTTGSWSRAHFPKYMAWLGCGSVTWLPRPKMPSASPDTAWVLVSVRFRPRPPLLRLTTSNMWLWQSNAMRTIARNS